MYLLKTLVMMMNKNSLSFIDKKTWKILDKTDKAILLEYSKKLKEIKLMMGDKYLAFAVDNILSFNDMSKYNRLKLLDKELIGNIKDLYIKNKDRLDESLIQIYELNYFGQMYVAEKITGVAIPAKKILKSDLNLLIKNKIFSLEDTVLNQANYLSYNVKARIYQGLIQGKSYKQIAKTIEDDLGKGAKRAMMTAQTEGHRVMSAARQDSMIKIAETIKMQKMWVGTLDSKTRPAHGDADGQTVDVDEPFMVDGEQLFFPGDPSGSAENTINCRCTQISVFPDLTYTNRRDQESQEYLDMQSYEDWYSNKF
jgi:SPP1 gp7 family putative phage head morphogenesis protein